MKIGLDAMGGDHSPGVCIGAALAALQEGLDVVLVGPKEVLRDEIRRHSPTAREIEVVHAPEVVGMGESPSHALRKKRSSTIAVGMELLRDGKIGAFVSAGNSGAVMASAFFTLGRLKTVDRPAIAIPLPSGDQPALLIDAGANVDCKPYHLVQFAFMGEAYAKTIHGLENPSVAVLSCGEEHDKGNELTKRANKLLRISGLNFIGNVEGRDLLKGVANVVVADGFYGNIALKSMEGVYEVLSSGLRSVVEKSILSRLGGALIKRPLSSFLKAYDYEAYGGAPLLGIDEVVLVAHGRSSARAILNALRRAKECNEKEVGKRIIEGMETKELLKKLSTLYDGN